MAQTATETSALRRVSWAAKRLDVSLSTAWRLIASGEIPSIRIGERVVRVDEAELEAWLEAKKKATPY